MTHGVLLPAMLGDAELVERSLELAAHLSTEWPKHRLPLSWPGRDAWLNDLREKAGDPAGLAAVVASEVALHKLDGLANR
jgi:hypothetical protein